MKLCNKCEIHKEDECFNPRRYKNGTVGFRSECISCCKARNKEYRARETIVKRSKKQCAEYYAINKDYIDSRNKAYCTRPEIQERRIQYATQYYSQKHGHSKYKTESLCRKILEKLLNTSFPKRRIKDLNSDAVFELDGYSKTLNLAFEYDGEQHFRRAFFDNSDQELIDRKQRDKLKDLLCLKAGITLIRIPYWEKHNLEDFILCQLMAR